LFLKDTRVLRRGAPFGGMGEPTPNMFFDLATVRDVELSRLELSRFDVSLLLQVPVRAVTEQCRRNFENRQ
jgi:hypothetical protein